MRLERDIPYWFLVVGSLGWIAIVLAAPVSAARGWSAGALAYVFFAPICHQIPERSFHFLGYPLAACHRCVGLYVGFAVGLLVLPYLGALRGWLLDRPRRLLLFFVPMAVDVALFKWNVPASRFATGFVAAFPIGLFVWAAAEQLYTQYFEPSERIDHEFSQSR